MVGKREKKVVGRCKGPDRRVQIMMVLRTIQDKEVDIGRLKEIVANNWEERMAAYENITK